MRDNEPTIIRTEYVNVNGKGRVRAKVAGKQRTVDYDPARSNNYNHGLAAGTVAMAAGIKWHKDAVHDSNDSGTKHGFFL